MHMPLIYFVYFALISRGDAFTAYSTCTCRTVFRETPLPRWSVHWRPRRKRAPFNARLLIAMECVTVHTDCITYTRVRADMQVRVISSCVATTVNATTRVELARAAVPSVTTTAPAIEVLTVMCDVFYFI